MSLFRLLLPMAAALVVVAGLLASCSSETDGDSPLFGEAVPFEQYCEQYSQMTCAVAERCDCLGGIALDRCHTYQAEECRDEVEAPVQAGRTGYDDVLAGRCLAELEAIISDCSLTDAYWPDACDDMLPGQVAPGGQCDGDIECQGSLECFESVCTALPRDGEPCVDGSYCAEDYFCGDDERCHGYRGNGQPCPEGDIACDDDLYCDGRTTTCEPYVSAGGSCAHDSAACDDDLHCSPSSQICAPYPGQGQSCADSSGECADYLYCDASQICQPELPGGSACADDEQCLSGECLAGQCEPDIGGDCPFL